MSSFSEEINKHSQQLNDNSAFTLPVNIAGVGWRDGFMEACGINAVTGAVLEVAIDTPQYADPGTMDLMQYSKSVNTQEDIDDLFSGYFSASINVEGITGNASTSFLSQVSYSSTSSTILFFRNDIEHDYCYLIAPALTTPALDLLNASITGFRATYGDYFINGIKSGSQIIFMLECKSDTEEHHTEFQAKIGAEIPDQLSADFQTTVNNISSTTNTSVSLSIIQTGAATPPNPIDWNARDLDSLIKNYIDTLSPVPQFVELSHYQTLPHAAAYPTLINYNGNVANSVITLYQDYWSIIKKYENTDTLYTDKFSDEYLSFYNGLPGCQETLVTDPDQFIYYRTLADRLMIYFTAISAIPAEQAVSNNTHNNDSRSGPQRWQYGTTSVSKGGVQVTTANVKRDNHTTGHKGGSLQVNIPSGIIVGWEIIPDWTDGTDGYWVKDAQIILMNSNGSIWAQSEQYRGLSWTANFYHVVSGDIAQPQ